MDEQDINEVYEIVGRVTHTLCEDFDSLTVAAVLMVMGMRIYKTVLDDADYHQIIQDVVARQDKVFPLEARTTRGFD
ncbi:hypothetical protein UFOVP328_354 [uncultured Caudovirales phage]|uniref:Uncharacterized protein n=1 Tax=uncultured Caudovirales phage TaxID=2100421 RepID=A0A6J5LVQ5_9CAUD|nr:hypothetical protein UFOVP328_354 [uncultured Caudovirales phage]